MTRVLTPRALRAPVARDPKLRPWWHVGVPFAIAAGMVGILGLASQNRAALLLCLLFVGWGGWWSLLARRSAPHLRAEITAAADLLAEPTSDQAVWLGPATLLLRPRKLGHLVWTPEGLTWTQTEVMTLVDQSRRVLRGTLDLDLSLPFGEIISFHYQSKMLSGDSLTLRCKGREIYRFRLADPATYSFVVRAFESRQIAEIP